MYSERKKTMQKQKQRLQLTLRKFRKIIFSKEPIEVISEH